MIEIDAPDGTVVEFPDGTSDAVITQAMQKAYPPAAKTPAGPAPSMMESFGKGMEDGTTFGFSDEMRSFGRGLGAMMVSRDYNDAYNRRYNQLKQERDAAKQNGWTYFGGELTGGIGTAVATAPISGVPSVAKFAQAHPYLTAGGLGGMSGYLYGAGTGEGTTQQRLEGAVPQAAFGMVAGPTATLLARSAVGPLSKRVLEYLEKRKAQPPRIPPTVSGNLSQDQVVNQMVQASDNALTPAPAGRSDTVAMNKMVEAIKRDYPDNYEQILSAWKDSNQPLAEISGPSMTRMATGAAQYESGLPKAVKYFSEQTGESADKLLKSVYQNIGDSRSYFATVDDVLAKGRAKAGPLYEQAFKSNPSIASKEIDNILSTPAGKKALADARMIMQNDRSLMGLPDKELGDIARELAQMGKMAESPGGVASGLNLRSLDYVKKALDQEYNMLKRSGANENAKTVLGLKQSLVEQLDSLDVTAKAGPNSLKLDGGLYAQARKSAGDYLSATDAMETGQNFMKVDPELIKKTLASKSPQDIEAFKLGMSKRIADLINDANEGKNPYQRVFGSETKKERLRVALAPDKYKKLEIDMKARNRLYEMGNKVLGGSPTTGKAMAAADLAPDEELITALTSGTKQNILGYLKKTFTGMGDDVANSVSDILYETDPTKKLQLLYNVNKSTLTSTEKQLVKEAYFQTADKLSFGSGVAGGIAVARKPPEEK